MESSKNIIKVKIYYKDSAFDIPIPKIESLYNLKHYIVENLKKLSIFTYDSNISIRYGFPPKLISDIKSDSKTLPELSITNNECLRVELIDPQCVKASENEIIDFSKYKVKKKTIPPDNSCLFNAVNFAVNNNIGEPEGVRALISMEIQEHLDIYNEAVLERPPYEYCEWIMNNDSWGGGIEISILSKYFNVIIGVVDIKNVTIEYFGENFTNIIYLLYYNMHYDVFYHEENGKEIGVFKINDEQSKNEVLEISRELKRHQKFVDTQNFSVKCLECNFLMKRQEDVIEHSKKTKHTNFSQI